MNRILIVDGGKTVALAITSIIRRELGLICETAHLLDSMIKIADENSIRPKLMAGILALWKVGSEGRQDACSGIQTRAMGTLRVSDS